LKFTEKEKKEKRNFCKKDPGKKLRLAIGSLAQGRR